MTYNFLFDFLKNNINYDKDLISLSDNIELRNFDFESKATNLLLGLHEFECKQHNVKFENINQYELKLPYIDKTLDVDDSHVVENQKFRYHLFSNKIKKSEGLILLFHGFNEKYWHKYYPWAYKICEETGKDVLLFPIAFHMNRAPIAWSDTKSMYNVSQERKKLFPDMLYSSLSNVAISTRMQAKPQRFFWSGLQTYYDVIQLLEEIKTGEHIFIKPNVGIDIMAYSIGGLLSQILLMTNQYNYFDNSKACIFCGGAVFNRMSSASKFILDSEASVALYSFIVEHYDRHIANDKRLSHYLKEQHSEGAYFSSMLNYKMLKSERENRFTELSDKFYAIALEKDTVIPPYEIQNSLQGSSRKIPVKIDVLDFDYMYKHEDPFPVGNKDTEIVNEAFDKFIIKAIDFLK